MAYLNVNILFSRILNEEGESILPCRVVGPVAGLQIQGERIPDAQFAGKQ